MAVIKMLRDKADDTALAELAREVELLALDDRAYGPRPRRKTEVSLDNTSGTEEISEFSSERRMESILLYLDMIGIGTDFDSTRTRIEKRLRIALKREYSEQHIKKIVAKREVLKEHDEVSRAIRAHQERDVSEPNFKTNEYYKVFEDKKKAISIYYYNPSNKTEERKESFYVYTPSGIDIKRVPQSELGMGVLGVAYIGLNLIKILDTLYGADFEEVKKHEILHHQYPSQPESWIRKKTSEELPYHTKYQ